MFKGSQGIGLRAAGRAAVAMAVAMSGTALPAGEGDEPLRDSAVQVRWAAIDLALFKNPASYAQGVEEQREKSRRRTEESRAKRIWLRQEGQAFAQLVTDLIEDTETCRQRRDKLRTAIDTAARFTQAGVELPAYRARFVDLVMLTAARPEVRSKLVEPVGPLAAGDFVGQSLCGIVSPNGELELPPDPLHGQTGGENGDSLLRRFREGWLAVENDVREGRAPHPARLEAMWSILEDWERMFVLSHDPPSPAAVTWVENGRRLLAALASPGERDELRAFLEKGGHAFPGGTHAELLVFLLKHRLYPRAGTPGSLAVATLTTTLTEPAKAEIAELERRLETLKRQNPAHNAVLRERMVPEYFADKSSESRHAGLNSPAFAE